jgi:hypothetical protein
MLTVVKLLCSSRTSLRMNHTGDNNICIHPLSRVLLEKMAFTHLVKKLLCPLENQNFITSLESG